MTNRDLSFDFFPNYILKKIRGGNFYPFPPLLAKPLAYLFSTNEWGIFFLMEKKEEYKNEFLEFPKINKLETNFYLDN
jgi:hypothetical protein